MLGLSLWVPMQGPSYNTAPPVGKTNETVFLSFLSATDGTTFDYSPDDVLAKLNTMLIAVRPVRSLLSQAFYPLTEWSIEEDGWLATQFCAWDAHLVHTAVFSRDSIVCVVQAFRRVRSTEAVTTLRLFGLHEQATYTIEDWLARSAPQQKRGSELMDLGLQIELPERPSATLLTLRLQTDVA